MSRNTKIENIEKLSPRELTELCVSDLLESCGESIEKATPACADEEVEKVIEMIRSVPQGRTRAVVAIILEDKVCEHGNIVGVHVKTALHGPAVVVSDASTLLAAQAGMVLEDGIETNEQFDEALSPRNGNLDDNPNFERTHHGRNRVEVGNELHKLLDGMSVPELALLAALTMPRRRY